MVGFFRCRSAMTRARSIERSRASVPTALPRCISTMTGARFSSRVAQNRLFPWVLAALGVAALVLIDLPVCGIRAFFGFACPGCGMTRAFSSLLAGDFAMAFAFHPLVFVLVAMCWRWLLCTSCCVTDPRQPGLVSAYFFLACSRLVFGLCASVVALVATRIFRDRFSRPAVSIGAGEN